MLKDDIKKYINELRSHGLTKYEADIIIAEYIEADRVGQYSHGTSALPNLIKRLEERKGPVKILKDSGPIAYLDGQKELGQLAAEKAVSMIIAKAKRYGIGFVGLRNILPFMRPGTFVKKLADKNLFALGMLDGGRPMVTHPDSPIPVIGTNPIAFGMPTAKGSLVVDMATSKKAWGEVKQALNNKILLPANAYKNKSGKFTRDPKKAFCAVPFGDYKGFALGMMVEILCGSFLDMPMGNRKPAKKNIARSRSAIFIAIDPSRFGALSKFKKETARFIQDIKSVKRNRGVKRLRVPGEASMRLR